MIKQSKLSKICWAFVYLFPLIFIALMFSVDPFYGENYVFADFWNEFSLPFLNIELFRSAPLFDLFGSGANFLDYYLGYLISVSLFRIVWKVLVYLPDVVGKLIDRWSL